MVKKPREGIFYPFDSIGFCDSTRFLARLEVVRPGSQALTGEAFSRVSFTSEGLFVVISQAGFARLERTQALLVRKLGEVSVVVRLSVSVSPRGSQIVADCRNCC